MKQTIVVLALLLGLGLIGYVGVQVYTLSGRKIEIANPLASLTEKEDKNTPERKASIEKYQSGKVFNILLLGSDYRKLRPSAGERTDVMILLTVNPEKKKAVLTSVPRDLWVGSGKINGLFPIYGYETLKAGIEELSGQKVDAFIKVRFTDVVWLVDQMGGLEVELDNSFVDSEFPDNQLNEEYMTVSFNAGKQIINGTQALQLSRSRHGTNGEGSDFMRMKRQHKILKAMPEAILSPKSLFNPFLIEKFFETVLTQGIQTDLTLDDAIVLWEYHKNRIEYTTESFYLDYEYLYSPPLPNEYGAWVLVPKNKDFTAIHNRIKELDGEIDINPVPTVNTTAPTSN